jgi:hypothetical protein
LRSDAQQQSRFDRSRIPQAKPISSFGYRDTSSPMKSAERYRQAMPGSAKQRKPPRAGQHPGGLLLTSGRSRRWRGHARRSRLLSRCSTRRPYNVRVESGAETSRPFPNALCADVNRVRHRSSKRDFFLWRSSRSAQFAIWSERAHDVLGEEPKIRSAAHKRSLIFAAHRLGLHAPRLEMVTRPS